MAFRAFVAVPVPPDVAFAALAEELRRLPADLSVADPARHHLTLAFLGDVPDEAQPALSRAVDEACAGEKAFGMDMYGVGAFPDARKPRVLWVGARPEPRLDRLAARVRERLAEAGHAGDGKPFRVHLTLARVRSARGLAEVASFLRRHAAEPLPTIPVDEVRLYRSTLDPEGARHEVLHAARLEA